MRSRIWRVLGNLRQVPETDCAWRLDQEIENITLHLADMAIAVQIVSHGSDLRSCAALIRPLHIKRPSVRLRSARVAVDLLDIAAEALSEFWSKRNDPILPEFGFPDEKSIASEIDIAQIQAHKLANTVSTLRGLPNTGPPGVATSGRVVSTVPNTRAGCGTTVQQQLSRKDLLLTLLFCRAV
jgi:hypothetical protein